MPTHVVLCVWPHTYLYMHICHVWNIASILLFIRLRKHKICTTVTKNWLLQEFSKLECCSNNWEKIILHYQTVLKILFFKNVFSCFVFFYFLIFKKTQNMHSYQHYVKQPEKKKVSVYCSCSNWKIKFKRWKL